MLLILNIPEAHTVSREMIFARRLHLAIFSFQAAIPVSLARGSWAFFLPVLP